MPSIEVIIVSLFTTTLSFSICRFWSFDRAVLSTFWPKAKTTASDGNSSNWPVGCGLPFSSSTIFSILRASLEASEMVDNHLTWMPSAIAASISSAFALIFSRLRRYTITGSAPIRRRERATSTAVLPPPYTVTRRAISISPVVSIWPKTDRAFKTWVVSPCGISAPADTEAPKPRITASYLPFFFSASMSSILRPHSMVTPISVMRLISASKMLRGKR